MRTFITYMSSTISLLLNFCEIWLSGLFSIVFLFRTWGVIERKLWVRGCQRRSLNTSYLKLFSCHIDIHTTLSVFSLDNRKLNKELCSPFLQGRSHLIISLTLPASLWKTPFPSGLTLILKNYISASNPVQLYPQICLRPTMFRLFSSGNNKHVLRGFSIVGLRFSVFCLCDYEKFEPNNHKTCACVPN